MVLKVLVGASVILLKGPNFTVLSVFDGRTHAVYDVSYFDQNSTTSLLAALRAPILRTGRNILDL